ncbi:3',5'-cyclic-nucleotide phosphodiesterase regA [Pelomyxa schiedti]|nr:3',5'-cyclic-nucleotide phosphodiesterase regA [Pelomyxa schiedti]
MEVGGEGEGGVGGGQGPAGGGEGGEGHGEGDRSWGEVGDIAASMLLFIDENADAIELEIQKSYMYDHITIMPNTSTIAGSGVDKSANRTQEAFVRSSTLKPIPVNRSAPCECNPYWLKFLEKFYPDEATGIPCERYCTTSKMMALNRHLGSIYIPVSLSIDGALRMWGLANEYSYTTFVYPWQGWRSLGLTAGEYMNLPDYQPLFWPMATPENNPANVVVWTDPYFTILEMFMQVGKQVYDKNNKFIAATGITLSLQKTCSLLTSVVTTPSGFSMLVSDQGYVISANLWAFPLLFGPSFNFSSRSLPFLTSAQANFSEFLSTLDAYGYSEIYLNGSMWIFAHHPLDMLPWTVVVAAPSSEILSGVVFSVEPATVQLTTRSSPVSFTVSLNNTGIIPVWISLEDVGSVLSSNFSEDILLYGGESSVILFTFNGHLPYTNRLWFKVRDAVTTFSLCFNSRYSVLLSLSADTMTIKVSASVGGAVALVFLVTVTALLLVIRYFKHKVAVLSQPLTGAQLFKTPAEAAIKKLSAITKKKTLEADDKLSLEKIIQLIATNGLHRVDYIAQKKACLANFDSEVNAYLVEQLISPQMKQEEDIKEDTLQSESFCDDNLEPVVFGTMDEWGFSAFEYAPDQILGKLVPSIFRRHGLFNKFNIDEGTLMSWLDGVTRGYLSNPYHNVVHAADVLQACHVMLLNLVDRELLSPLSVLSLLFSAIVHDLAHPGVNNNFLYRIFDPLALTYNGISVLENMHVHEAFEFTLHSGFNWLSFFSSEDFLEFHKQVTSLILATDMSKHVELLSFFKSKQSVDGFNLSNKSDLTSVLQIILKMADISNQTREWNTASKWTTLVVEECFQQGDQEEKYNLPKSPFMDRNTPHVPKCQCTFIQFVVTPLFESVAKMIDPQLTTTMKNNLASNLERWQNLVSQPSTPSHSKPSTPRTSTTAAAASHNHKSPATTPHYLHPPRSQVTSAATTTTTATIIPTGASTAAINSTTAATATTAMTTAATAHSKCRSTPGNSRPGTSGGALSRGASYVVMGSPPLLPPAPGS